MRGHVRLRETTLRNGKKSRLYYAVVYRGADPVTQKKTYDWGRGYRTRREAEAVLNERLAALGSGTYIRPVALTLGDYLHDSWLPSVRPSVKESTFRTYTWVVDRYLAPLLGARRIQDLATVDVNTAYGRLLSGDLPEQIKHPGRKNRPLSPKSVLNIHRVLTKALEDAVDAGLVGRNVAARAKRPALRAPQMSCWTAADLAGFLQATKDSRQWPMWHVASMTGLRRGEVLGLRWEDLDLEDARMMVRQALVSIDGIPTITTPKNGRARVVDLDPDTVAVLRALRLTQKAERLAWGPGYGCNDLVFTKEDGTAYHPDVITTAFTRQVKAATSPRIRLHDLRHTHATLLIKAGVPVNVVSQRLGHSSPAFTLAVYAHVLPGQQADAAATFAAVITEATRMAT
ncbi:MAG: tyrosine-type recombinase/integrase [Acidimicrobiales bacterium]|nr:tyrosine-type recombinase/integrase [Acidimicrobiales bacterium]